MGEKHVEGLGVRHLFLEASPIVLLVLVVCALSNAQTAKPDDGSIATGADVFPTLVADSFQTQDYLSSSGKKALDDQPPGYISGTILDQSGAVNVGADVRLTDEERALHQEVKSGGNGEFLFTNVAAGSFQVTVNSPGFATREFAATLRPGETYLVPPIILAVAPALTELGVRDNPLTLVQAVDMQIAQRWCPLACIVKDEQERPNPGVGKASAVP